MTMWITVFIVCAIGAVLGSLWLAYRAGVSEGQRIARGGKS